MRKALNVVLVLCVASAVAAGRQGAGVESEGHGLEVVGFNWKYEGYAPVDVVERSVLSTPSVKRGKAYVFKYRAQLTLKNAGARAVKSVHWDYVFADPEAGKELARYKVETRTSLRPGQTLTLAKDILFNPKEPTAHVSTGKQQVSITRVEYADGPAWKAKD